MEQYVIRVHQGFSWPYEIPLEATNVEEALQKFDIWCQKEKTYKHLTHMQYELLKVTYSSIVDPRAKQEI